jgi:DNA invertase Pin-like site-specific DNA recombinase
MAIYDLKAVYNKAMRKSTAAASKASKRAVALIRVSTDKQATEGASLDTQDAAIEKYCALRGLDLPIERVLKAKEGSSARKPLAKRPEGRQLLAMIERGEVQHVVATKLDRLFRNAQDALNHIADWNRRGVALHILQLGNDGPMDTSSTTGRLFFQMLSAINEFESRMTGDRIREVKSHLRRNGQSYSDPPFGYSFAPDRYRAGKVVNRALVAVPEERAIIRRIQRLRSRGRTYQAIAELLNDKGVRTKKPGSKWHAMTVRNIDLREKH